jgi:hypothetical protein
MFIHAVLPVKPRCIPFAAVTSMRRFHLGWRRLGGCSQPIESTPTEMRTGVAKILPVRELATNITLFA